MKDDLKAALFLIAFWAFYMGVMLLIRYYK